MAQQLQTVDGTFTIPGAYSSVTVEGSVSGLATNGVIMLVGEADAGPDFSEESELPSFGPNQEAAVKAKYGSGPIVDAFRAAATPSADPNITGAPTRIIIAKTNVSTQAKSALLVDGGGDYEDADGLPLFLADKSFGKNGNLINRTIEELVSETVPTTGAFTWLLPLGTVDAEIRVNGGAAQVLGFNSGATPAAAATEFATASGVTVSGGVAKTLLPGVAGNLTLVVNSGNNVTVSYSGTLSSTLVAGDTLYIPTSSPIAGASNENAGSYVVTSATTGSITAVKMRNGTGSASASVTAPAGDTGAVAATTDIQAWSAITVSVAAGDPVAGVGKSLEVAELDSGGDLLSRNLAASSTALVDWVSTEADPTVIASEAETKVRITVARAKDNITEEIDAGGEIALKLGYVGTAAVLTIDDTTMTLNITGGSGSDLSIDLEDFDTIQDVATYINSQTGYSAEVGTALLGQLPSTALDNVASLGFASTNGALTGRVKIDAYRLAKKLSEESSLVQLQNSDGDVVEAAAGLPAVASLAFLSGGTKGGTTNANVIAALTALEKVRGNFLVPCFSRDAADDKQEKLTDVSSTYEIDAINAAVKTHVLKMSQPKRRKPRQAFISKEASFSDTKQSGANVASPRMAFPFQNVTNPDSSGSLKIFKPWMAAANAAGLQAAGFYRSIMKKFANINGISHEDFDPEDEDQVEEALLSGLLPLKRAESGGFQWVSDQTTYGKDNNFVYNSIQAVYVADIIATTCAQEFERAFVGQSVADVDANLAMAFLETMMDRFRTELKLIAPSSDAPRGFKDATITISGNSLIVRVNVKLASTLAFVHIPFVVSMVQQSA